MLHSDTGDATDAAFATVVVDVVVVIVVVIVVETGKEIAIAIINKLRCVNMGNIQPNVLTNCVLKKTCILLLFLMIIEMKQTFSN